LKYWFTYQKTAILTSVTLRELHIVWLRRYSTEVNSLNVSLIFEKGGGQIHDMSMKPKWTVHLSASQEIIVIETKDPEAVVSLRYVSWSSNVIPELYHMKLSHKLLLD
jgi:hypothetical protein